MDCVIPESVVEAARLTPAALKLEVAVLLYTQERLTLVQAAHLAERSPYAFQQELGSRGIGPHYDVSDLEEDVATLRAQDRL